MSYRKLLNVFLLVVFLGFMSVSGAWAQVVQTPLAGKTLLPFSSSIRFRCLI